MANKDFVVKNGLTVSSGGVTIGSTERISSAGLITGVTTTQSSGTDSMAIASTAFVQQELASLVDSAPSTLNTLNELAAALGDDASFSTTVTNSIAAKLPLAGGTLTGALIVTDGSTSAPSIGNSGDTNSGIYFPADDQMGLVVGGSRKLLANSDGITINNGDLTIPSKIIHDGDTDTYLRFNGADDFRIVVGNSTRAAFNTSKIHFNQEGINQDFQVEGQGTGNEGLLYVDASANQVGIGTTSPGDELEISGNNGALRITDTDGGYCRILCVSGNLYYQADEANSESSSFHRWDIDGTDNVMRLTNTGLGLGTTSPSSTLHLSGNSDTSDEDCMIIINDEDDSAGSQIPAIQFRGDNNNIGRIRANGSLGLILSGSSAQGDDLVVQAGKVGIGTTSPSTDLHLYSTADNKPHILLEGVQNHDTDDAPKLEFYANDSTTGGIGDSTYVGEIVFSGDEKDGNSKEIYGEIRGMALDPGSGTSNKGSIELWSQVGGSLSRVLNARQIHASGATGAVGINEVNPAYTFDINTTGESNAFRIYQGSGSSKDCSILMQNVGTGSGDDTVLQLYTAHGAGDPKIRWAISGQETWEMGIDNSVSDRLKISNGSALGTTDWMIIGGNAVYLGNAAGGAITTGGYNVAIGSNALDANTEGGSNVAVGYNALSANTTADNNTAVGSQALKLNTGSKNVGVGNFAGQACTSGVNNVFIGRNAGYDATDADNNVFIGQATQNDNAGTSNQVVIGNTARSQGGGKFTVGTSSSTYTVVTMGSTSWGSSSDVRLKKEITDSTAGLSFINDLRPVTFKWKTKGEVDTSLPHYEDGSSELVIGNSDSNILTKHGFIAQEVKTAIDNHTEVKDGSEIWEENRDGIQNFSPTALIPMLVKAIQELEARVKELEG